MLNWIVANLATIIVCVIMSIITAFIIAYMIKNKKKGNSPCGCNCSGCSHCGAESHSK